MLKKSLMVILAALIVLGPIPGEAMQVDVPLPIVCGNADAVVVVEVLGAPNAVGDEMALPGYKQKVKGWFRFYNVKVTSSIKGAAAKGKELTLVARAPQPAGPNGRRFIMMDGPAYPSLTVGDRYIVVLKKMDGKGKYHLPAYFKNFRRESEQELKRYVQASDSTKWAWGKSVNGLRMAITPSRTELMLPRGKRLSYVRKNGKMVRVAMPPSVYVQGAIILQNTSDKPISVNLYRADKFMSIQAANAAGKVVKVDLYTAMLSRNVKAFDAKDVVVIEPGKTKFIASYGASVLGFNFRLPVKPGKWTLGVGYASKRAKGAGGEKLWAGSVTSAPVELTVKTFPKPKRR
jgi:hypothetical protein